MVSLSFLGSAGDINIQAVIIPDFSKINFRSLPVIIIIATTLVLMVLGLLAGSLLMADGGVTSDMSFESDTGIERFDGNVSFVEYSPDGTLIADAVKGIYCYKSNEVIKEERVIYQLFTITLAGFYDDEKGVTDEDTFYDLDLSEESHAIYNCNKIGVIENIDLNETETNILETELTKKEQFNVLIDKLVKFGFDFTVEEVLKKDVLRQLYSRLK